MKPADKGGAVVVWLRQLFVDEARKQLSNQRFYKKLGSNPSNDDQQQVKSTITEMINNNKLPPSATNLVVTTRPVFICYPRFTSLVIRVD